MASSGILQLPLSIVKRQTTQTAPSGFITKICMGSDALDTGLCEEANTLLTFSMLTNIFFCKKRNRCQEKTSFG